MGPTMEQIRGEHGETPPAKKDGRPGRERAPIVESEWEEQHHRAVAGELKEAVPGHCQWIAMVFAEGVNQEAANNGGILFEECVAEPVDRAGGKVGQKVAERHGDSRPRIVPPAVHFIRNATCEGQEQDGEYRERCSFENRHPEGALAMGNAAHGLAL